MTAVRPAACPDRAAWEAFADGRAAADLADAWAAHLDTCGHCQTVVGGLTPPADPIVAELRQLPDPGSFSAEPECRSAVLRLQAWADAPPPPPAPKPAAPAAGPVPARLGEYRVVRPIGRGGMGAVYEAVHDRLGRTVALKTFPPGKKLDPAAVARFRREAGALGKADHPNVVRATDAGEADGVAFLVMERVAGADLGRLVRAAGPLPPADAAEVGRQAALGLAHLAGLGLVHRDVKPANLMVGRDGTVKLLDLGLAVTPGGADADTTLTAAGHVLGSFDYVAPEQTGDARGVDGRADVYGLGATLYYALTGSPPYPSPVYPTPRAKVLAHVGGPVPDVAAARPDLPPGLAAAVARMLAKDPAARFPDAAAVADALAPFAADSRLADRVAAVGEPTPDADADPATVAAVRRPVWVRRTAWAAGLLLAVGGTVAAGLAVAPDRRDRTPVAAVTPPDLPPVVVPAQAEARPAAVYPAAVLVFDARDAALKDTAAKVTDLLVARLSARPDVFLVDRADLHQTLREQGLSAVADPATAVRLGHLTGAKVLIIGTVQRTDREFVVIAKAVGTETTALRTAVARVPADADVGPAVDRLAEQLADLLTNKVNLLVPPPAPAVDRVAALRQRLGNRRLPDVVIRVDGAVPGLAELVRGAGFGVIDADRGNPGDAAVVLTASASAEPTPGFGGLVGAKARVTLQATSNGRLIAQHTRAARAVDVAPDAARDAALRDAAASAAEAVLPPVAAAP